MNRPACDREATLLARLREGRADEEDRRHLESCPDCALAASSDRWMSEAADRLRPRHLPSPGSLLFRARLRARREAAERALRPLAIWRRLALAGAAACLGAIALSGSFFAGLADASISTPLALFVAGSLALGALPFLRPAGRDAA